MANYVAQKSIARTITIMILLCWLIIPIFIGLYKIIKLLNEKIEFYDNKIIVKSGLIAKKEDQIAFTGVVSVRVEQSIWGRIFNYGDVYVDLVGKSRIDTNGIRKPILLKKFLEQHIITNNSNYQQIVSN